MNVLFGSATGITASGAQACGENSQGVPGTAGERDSFGYALTIGDFNRDVRGDLAIGAPGQEIGAIAMARTVTVLPGTTTGLASAGAAIWHQDSPGVANANDTEERFGEAVHVVKGRAGEFDALAVGAPETPNLEDAEKHGALIVLQGSSTGITGAGSASWTTTQLTGGVVAGGHLGSPLA